MRHRLASGARPATHPLPQTITNLALNKGNAVPDRPQQVVSGIWELPFLKNHTSWAGRDS